MKRIPVIIDCDTGIDDAIALLVANKLPGLDIRALTTVAGNATLENTTRNTLAVAALAEMDVPVYAGAAKPVYSEQVTAAYIHGRNGLGGVELPLKGKKAETARAWDAIYDIARSHKGELELIAVGPLTNIAMALIKHRDLKEYVRRIVIMGGAASGGNIRPAAEFNIYADPEAAAMVFDSGIPIAMCGLDVTLKTQFTPADIEAVRAMGGAVPEFVYGIAQSALDFSMSLGLEGMCMHDPLTVIYSVEPEMFTAKAAGVHVETKGPITKGKTVTDLYSDKKFPVKNALVVTDVDSASFRARIFELLSHYAEK